MVFQSYALYPHMTVRQNIAFPLTLAKLSRSEIDAKVEDTAKVLDLTELLDRKPSQLSGGQRQRVGLARAIYGDPTFVLLDEPNSSLDEAGEQALLSMLLALKQRRCTTIIITHRTSVLPAADKILLLRDGQVAGFGPRDDILNALKQAQLQKTAQAIPPATAVQGAA